MKKIFTVSVFLVILSSIVFGTWALIPLDELVADSDLVVIGTLISAKEDRNGIGAGYILIDSIVTPGTKTFEGQPLMAGNRLKIKWADDWACAEGMHLSRQNQMGIWLLKAEPDGTVRAGYPGRFRSVEGLHDIRELLNREKKKPSAVDIADEESNERPTVLVDDGTHLFHEFSLTRALIALLLSTSLYILLYKSRFRIR